MDDGVSAMAINPLALGCALYAGRSVTRFYDACRLAGSAVRVLWVLFGVRYLAAKAN